MGDSLERLWDLYSQRLLAFIRSRVEDQAEAEDILQEVFIRVHRSLCCRPEPDWEKPESWIYQIARNLIIDHYRRRRDLLALSDSLADDPDLSDPDHVVFARIEEDPQVQIALSLKDMIEALPEPYRSAILLTEYQGLTQKQMAESLGLSLSGAKSRVQRAREKLREMLLSCCHFELDRRGRILDFYPHCCCCSPAA